jgi:hypothetical protein
MSGMTYACIPIGMRAQIPGGICHIPNRPEDSDDGRNLPFLPDAQEGLGLMGAVVCLARSGGSGTR